MLGYHYTEFGFFPHILHYHVHPITHNECAMRNDCNHLQVRTQTLANGIVVIMTIISCTLQLYY